METFDAVVVGSGHNALVTAAYLARAGWAVLVLERNDRPGGLVRTEELTLPGFLHDTYAAAHPLLASGPVLADLGPELAGEGLRYLNTPHPTGVVLPGGATAVLSTDREANLAEAERLAPGDGAALAEVLAGLERVAGTVFDLFSSDLHAPGAAAAIHQLMGGPDYSEFAHSFLLTARDLLEQRFTSPVLRGMLAPWALHLGRGPDEANSAFWVVLALMSFEQAGMPIPQGGSERLATALTALVERHGGQVRCGRTVTGVLVEDGRASGVRTADGERFAARRAVVASVNPDQLYLTLLDGSDVVPPAVRASAGRYRYGRGCVQIHLALSAPPAFPDERLSGSGQPHLTGGLDAVSRATNEALRGLLPAEPSISLDIPSVLDPSRCPEGRAVARLQMLEVPCRPRGDAAGVIDVGEDGWTPGVKEAFADRVLEQAGRYLPDLPGAVLDRHVICPTDIAAFNPNAGPGDPYGGSHDLAQSYVFSPLPGQAGHRTVVPDLYMVGAATWPGHGVNGGSGYIVARELLRG